MRNQDLTISTCPTCGSRAIQKVWGTWSGSYLGKAYSVEDVEYFACPKCQERIYPPAAMQKIQAASPAYSRPASQRRAARQQRHTAA